MNNIKAWPFEEARKIIENINHITPTKGYVLFETGYGPSGLPHIGTFGEVVRTCFVKFAFEKLAPQIPTKLLCVSDDIDAMRKIPDNIPNCEGLEQYLGTALTSVPDPFCTTTSYGHNMNARLRSFLDSFGFKYDFISATEMYKSGKFNHMITRVLEKYDDIMRLMLQNLGDERRETYSPIMPIDKNGKVFVEGVISVNANTGTVTYKNENGEIITQSALNGGCKLQWKVDFAARWFGLEVNYEIYGKEHFANEKLYRKLCEILGGKPPVNFYYELFLDDAGHKISKTKGNGISVEEWLKYAPAESIVLFMYQKPKTAKRLYFDSIPKAADEYISYISAYSRQNEKERFENPTYYIHFGDVPNFDLGPVNYSLLLNLVSACNPANEDIIWGFLEKYNNNLVKGKYPFLDAIVKTSINYYNDFIKPHKVYRKPDDIESNLLQQLADFLKSYDGNDAMVIQNKVYEIGTNAGIDLKSWFSCIYETCLGQKEGPRVGSFIAIYGTQNMLDLMAR